MNTNPDSTRCNEGGKVERAEMDQVSLKAVAWMRRWHFDKETPKKVKQSNGRWAWPHKFKFLPVSTGRIFPDDVPLFAQPFPEPPEI